MLGYSMSHKIGNTFEMLSRVAEVITDAGAVRAQEGGGAEAQRRAAAR